MTDSFCSTRRPTPPARALLLLFLVLALVAAGCGGDDAADEGTTTATEDAGGADSASDEPSDAGASDEPSEAADASSEDSAEPVTVTIAHLADLTGPTAEANAAQIRGMDLALAELEESSDVTIEIQREDTGGDPTRALALMREVDANEDVVLQIGPAQTPEFFAAVPVAEQLELPTYSIISGGVFPGEFNEWTWRSGFPDNTAIPDLVEYASDELGASTAAVLFANDNDFSRFGGEFYETTASEAGLEVTSESFSESDTDFSAQVSNVASSEPDVVFISTIPDQAGFLIKSIRDGGIDAPILATNNSVGDVALVADNSEAAADGVIVAAAFDPASDRQIVQDYLAAFDEAYPDTDVSFSPFGYDGIMIVADAVSRIDGEVTRESVREAMGEVQIEGLTGERLLFPDGFGDVRREGVALLEISGDQLVTLDR